MIRCESLCSSIACDAARPMPLLLPVISMVWPAKEVVEGMGFGFVRNCDSMKTPKEDLFDGVNEDEDMV